MWHVGHVLMHMPRVVWPTEAHPAAVDVDLRVGRDERGVLDERVEAQVPRGEDVVTAAVLPPEMCLVPMRAPQLRIASDASRDGRRGGGGWQDRRWWRRAGRG